MTPATPIEPRRDEPRKEPCPRWGVAGSVVLSVALHALAFPPFTIPSVAWVALVPLLYWLPQLTLRSAALTGLLWGTLAIWTVALWVPPALLDYYQQPWWFGLLFCVTGSILLWGAYYGACAAGAAWLGRRIHGAPRAFLVATLWVSCELARTRFFTEEPWMLLGYALSSEPLLTQTADLGGVYLLSFLIALVNASITEFLLTRSRTFNASLAIAGPPAVAVAAALAYGAFRLGEPLPSEPRVLVTVVQGNAEVGTQWRPEYYGRGLDRYLGLTQEATLHRRPAVVVWPEAAMTFILADEPLYRRAIAFVLEPLGADLLVGGPHRAESGDAEEDVFYNSAYYLSPMGAILGRYDKEHLLPFGEYFPLRFIQFLRRSFERVRTFTPGDGSSLLATRMGKAAVVICFEAIFPDLVRRRMARGAELLVNLSNDAWLGNGAGAEQHLSMVVLRAVENRTWVVRATSTGISAVIDPLGRVRMRTPVFEPATLDGEIVPAAIDTFYKKNGDVFAFASLAATILSAIAVAVRERSKGVR